jgi:hypothetical protein
MVKSAIAVAKRARFAFTNDSFTCGTHLVRRPGGLASSSTQDPWLCVSTSRWICLDGHFAEDVFALTGKLP